MANHQCGDPVRVGFYGSTGSTSQSLVLTVPGSNTAYPFAPTDYLYLTSWEAGILTSSGGASVGSAAGLLLSLAAGAVSTSVGSSTIMGAFGGANAVSWTDPYSEGMAAPQGIIPSILGNLISGVNSTGIVVFAGTGMVVHAPGTTRPSFMNPQVPTG